MVSRLRRAGIPHRNDPHDWNSWDNYRNVHDRRLSEHPFVASYQDTLTFEVIDDGHIRLDGYVLCRKGVLLEVTKILAARYDNQRRRSVRCYSYRYVGIVPGRCLLLKYHNWHANPDDYIHRVYDPVTGKQTLYEVLQRHQFPTFSEVLDELECLAHAL